MGAVHLSQMVIQDMLPAGHGFISLTGATRRCEGVPALRRWRSLKRPADARSILGPRISPEGIHVVHVIVDGQIDTAKLRKLRAREPNRAGETIMSPDSIAELVLFTLKQTPDAWTHEIDLRPHLESF